MKSTRTRDYLPDVPGNLIFSHAQTQYYFQILLPLFCILNLKFWELHAPPLVNKSVLLPLTSPGSLLRIPSPSLNLQYTQKSIIQEPSHRPSPPWNFSDPSNQETSSYFCFFLFLFCFVLIYKGLWILVVKFILTQFIVIYSD